MSGYVDVLTAAALTGEGENRIREKMASGVYKTIKRRSENGGGSSGVSNLIAVSSLPLPAQIRYHAQLDDIRLDGFDFAGYKNKFGEEGEKELLRKLSAVRAGRALRASRIPNLAAEMEALAADFGVSVRALYHWIEDCERLGVAGIAKSVKRSDKGTLKSVCLAAQREAYRLYLQTNKRTKTTVYEMLIDLQRRLGPEACEHCAHNGDSETRAQLIENGEADEYPLCAFPNKCGLVVPVSRQTIGRMLDDIPDDMVTLARRGVKAWKDGHMKMANRKKPELVNQVWFGDHHQFDCFVLDEHGKAVRPWLTAWYDAATGTLVGWVISTNPCTETITEAFVRAVAHSSHSPFHGLPVVVYIDNGKDYRSKLFEGAPSEIDLGTLNSSFANVSIIKLFNINVIHAVPYNAWSKTIERFFGTLEGKWIREVPGWCGNSPEERPETFNRDIKRLIENGTLWTMDEFFRYFRDTALPAYHSRPHEGLNGKMPLELYDALPRARDDQPSWAVLSGSRMNRVQRTVRQNGIRFNNAWYNSPDLACHAGKDVTLCYSNADKSVVSVILGEDYLCEAALDFGLPTVGADPVELGAHIGRQKGQLTNTKERIRRATRSAFFEDVDERQNAGSITGIQYEKLHRSKAAHKKKQAEQSAARLAALDQPVSDMLLSLGDEVMQRKTVN